MATKRRPELKRNALERAQDLIYEAWEAHSLEAGVALARRALEVSPDCADAYVYLAAHTARSHREAMDLYQKGIEAGERALGEEFFQENAGYFWGILETRPYMRARASLAQCLWEAGRSEESFAHYWELLRLNPNDNQGLRYLLLPRLIEMGRDAEAERLFKSYQDDAMAVWLYSKALLDFRAGGDGPKARKSLKAALKENPHVPPYLLGAKRLSRSLPAFYGFGDENEAILYVHEAKKGWRKSQGALAWLGAHADVPPRASRSRT